MVAEKERDLTIIRELSKVPLTLGNCPESKCAASVCLTFQVLFLDLRRWPESIPTNRSQAVYPRYELRTIIITYPAWFMSSNYDHEDTLVGPFSQNLPRGRRGAC